MRRFAAVITSAVLLLSLAEAATVVLPAGSENGLAAAIAAAGPGGKVIVARGLHIEGQGVTITQPVAIVGEDDATLEFTTATAIEPPYAVDAAFRILGARNVRLEGLTIVAAGGIGGTGVLLEGAPSAKLLENRITSYQFGILVERADDALIVENRIEVTPDWQTGLVPEAHGIVVINGRDARIRENKITGGFFGIWACDERGQLVRNEVSESLIGIILCKVPEGAFLIGGVPTGAQQSAVEWTTRDNDCHDNFDVGYLVIDGANNNRLTNNAAARNANYDIELVGDSYRFGFFTPTSFENRVVVGRHRGLVIKDCGRDNRVNAPTVDVTQDPCF